MSEEGRGKEVEGKRGGERPERGGRVVLACRGLK